MSHPVSKDALPPATLSGEGEGLAHSSGHFWVLALGSIGVVFGDIGTSPLYALQTALGQFKGSALGPAEVIGVVSLIIWALLIVVTGKYVLFLMQADNKGEGGILSLKALAQRALGQRTRFCLGEIRRGEPVVILLRGHVALQHCGFVNQPAFGEARQIQQRCVDQIGFPGKNQVAENLSRGGSVHHAVSAETVGEEKSGHTWSFSENWVVVRRHLIQAGPRPLRVHREVSKAGHAVGGPGQDLFDKGRVEIHFEAWRFFGIVPGEKKAAGFGAKVKSVRHVDDHGRGVREFVKGLAGDEHPAQRLDSYRSAERALVTWLEDQLAAEGREKLARKYRRALTHAPTRPHPRCPRSGPLCHTGFWLHGGWDRVLDTMDSRPGVGFGFPVPSPDDSPAPPAGEGAPPPAGS